jgi:hypothetical protein
MTKLLAAKAMLIDRHFPAPARRIGLALHAAWPLTRWLAFAAAARLSGKPEAAARADEWREVWARRGEWQAGYAQGARGRQAPASAAAPAGQPTVS